MEEYFQSDSEGYVVKDFDKVDNWYVWEGDQRNCVVDFEDYTCLLEAYKELKHRMEGLEK